MKERAFRISKGDHRICLPEIWNVDRPLVEPSHKLYLPVSGSAEIELDDRTVDVRPGRFYYFPAYRPMRYGCRAPFELYWMHVDVLDPELDLQLGLGIGASSWPVEEQPFLEEPFQEIRDLEHGLSPAGRIRIEAVAMWLLSRVLDENEARGEDPERESALLRIHPAIAYMNDRYLESPSLKTVAAKVSLSPEHFHRIFGSLIGITPFQYMLRRRMAAAMDLLRATADPVSEVAEACGYDNPFYFSRAFKQFYGLSPSQARSQARRQGP